MSYTHINSLVTSHVKYASSILTSNSLHKCRGVLFRSNGIPALEVTAFLLFLFQLLLHATLPSRSPSISTIRLIFCYPLVLTILWPYIQDRGELVTFGNDFRDIAVLGLLWLPLSETFRICVVSLWDDERQRAPRWIVPLSQAHKWAGAVPFGDDDEMKVKIEKNANPTKDIPSQWAIVPHPPPFTLLRLLWAIDNMTLRRPGTSWLFPSQQRAMEWSHGILVKSSQLDNTRKGSIWFGKREWGPFASVVHIFFLVTYSRFVTSFNLSIQMGTYHPKDFFHLPLVTQSVLTFGVGALVVLPLSSIEWILYYTFKHLLRLPTTAICPAFQRPLFAAGPTDFWNRRWHQFLRRDFSTVARIVPGARESNMVRFIATFAVSAAEHSFVFSRFLPRPPTIFHAVWLFFQPAFHIFFLSQAALILIERFLFGDTAESNTFASALARRTLLWVGILASGRYLVAHMWALGCFDVVEFTNWSYSAQLGKEIWTDFTA